MTPLELIRRTVEVNPDRIHHVNRFTHEILIDVCGENNADNMEILKLNPAEFQECFAAIKSEIITRPDYSLRVEAWECMDMDGNYSERTFKMLRNERKTPVATVSKALNKRALKELCKGTDVPPGMEAFYLNELKLDNTESNKPRRDYAIRLGLINI
jgi:hypothetical protein